MDRKEQLIIELESILTEEINCAIQSPVYEQIRSSCPRVSIEKACENLKKEIYRCNVLAKIVKLAEEYKNYYDYVSEYDVIVKLADLFSAAGEPVTFAGFNKEEMEIARKHMMDVKENLYSLGFNDFKVFENETSKDKIGKSKNGMKDADEKAYYEEMFTFSNNTAELITLYCKNTSYKKGVNKKRLKMIQEILLRKGCDVSSDLQFFEGRIRRRYRSLGIK